jgi:hypothetical protein
MRLMQIDLFKMLIDDPRLRPTSPSLPDIDTERRRRAIFTNLVFRYLELGLEIGYFTPEVVRLELNEQLRLEEIRTLWEQARPKFEASARRDRQYEFLRLIEAAYRDATPTLPSAEDGPQRDSPPWSGRRRTRVIVTVGAALVAGAVLARSIVCRRVRSGSAVQLSKLDRDQEITPRRARECQDRRGIDAVT